MEIAYEINVSGRVQGVGFRWNTRNRARHLGLTGWVMNNPDRSVSAHVQGPEDKVLEMIEFLKKGPFDSRIDIATVNKVALVDDINKEFIVRFI